MQASLACNFLALVEVADETHLTCAIRPLLNGLSELETKLKARERSSLRKLKGIAYIA